MVTVRRMAEHETRHAMSVAGTSTKTVADKPGAVPGDRRPGARNRWRWPLIWLAVLLGLAPLGLYNGLVFEPHLDLSHRLAVLAMLYDVALAAVVVWCGLLLGLLGLRLLRLGRVEAETPTDTDRGPRFAPGMWATLATGLGLGMLSLLTLALGAVHLYYGVTFALLLAGLPLLLRREAAAARELLRAMAAPLAAPLRALREWRRGRSLPVTVVSNAALRVLLILVCMAVAALMLAIDLIPPHYLGFDTYQYHWAIPLLLLRAHGWLAFPGWAHANLPYNSEMLNLVALSLGAPQAATLIQDSFLLLSALLLFGLVRRYLGATAAWLAVTAVITLPLVLLYSDLSYVETALIFYGLAAMVVLLRWLEALMAAGASATTSGASGAVGTPEPRLLVLAGGYLGLALGVKYTALEYVPAAVLMTLTGLAVWLWRSRRVPGASGAWSLRHLLGTALVFVLAVLLPLSPWLLKDWVLLGDPVYPALSQLFPTPAWDAARTATLTATFARFGAHGGSLTQLRLYAVDMFLHPKAYGEGENFPVGLPAAAGMLVLPYAVYALGARLLRGRWLAGRTGLLIAVLALWTLSVFGVWTFSGALVERYALPGIVLAGVLGVVLLSWLLSRLPADAFVFAWLLVALIVATGLSNVDDYLYKTYTFRNPWAVATGAVSEQSYFRANAGLDAHPPSFFSAVDYINGTLPHDGKLLMLGRGTGYFFTDRDYVADSGGDWVPYIVSEGKTPDGMLSMLHRQGFTYVVYDASLMGYLTEVYENNVLKADLLPYLAFQQQKLIPIAHWGDVWLYRVP